MANEIFTEVSTGYFYWDETSSLANERMHFHQLLAESSPMRTLNQCTITSEVAIPVTEPVVLKTAKRRPTLELEQALANLRLAKLNVSVLPKTPHIVSSVFIDGFPCQITTARSFNFRLGIYLSGSKIRRTD